MNERMSLGAATSGFALPFERLVELYRGDDAPEPVYRDDLSRVYTWGRILEWLNQRIVGKLRSGQIPTAEGSVMKLILADLVSGSAETGVNLLGSQGTILGEEGVQQAFLGSRAFHIGGGTDEIQRNLIAERVLGLPREPQPDRELPFRETVRA
jgi:hypothetical protein